ncbi:hypothetical protein FRC17_003967 [Serendipita sp. 399]|nr:hypothetical protein FRC17_003967 [Serendipita sp. 399]
MSKDPVKSLLLTLGKQGAAGTAAAWPSAGIADNEATPGGQPSIAKVFFTSSSRKREARASTSAAIDDDKNPSKSGDEPELALEGDLNSNPIVIKNKQHDVEGYTQSSSPKRKEGDRSPYLPRKRSFEDDGSDNAIVEVMANKKMRLSLSREASPTDFSSILHFNFDTEVREPYSFDEVNQLWETDVSKPEDIVDDLLGRGFMQGNDNLSAFVSVPPASIDWDWEERETPDEVVAAPLSADDRYIRACEKLRAYKAQVDAGHGFKAQKAAREEMVDAWRDWSNASTEFVGMGELRMYGDALDAEGREAIAIALGVQSEHLRQWIEEAPSSRRGRRTPERSPTADPDRRVIPSLPPRADAPVLLPIQAPIAPPADALNPIVPSSLTSIPTLVQILIQAPVHTQRRRRIPAPAQTATTSQGPAPIPTLTPTVSTVHASSSNPAPIPTHNSGPFVGHPVTAPTTVPTAAAVPATAPTPAVPAPVPQSPIFTTPPAGRVAGKKEDARATGKLPSWTKDVLYTDSKTDLSSWTDARKAALRHNPIGMSQAEEQRILGELYGTPRADLTPQERRFSAQKRACDALPNHQKPILLDERSSAQIVANDRGYMLICRASFALEDQTFNYRNSICGQAFSTHDIVLRHIKEQHLDKGRKEKRQGGNAPAATTATSAVTSTSANVSASAAAPPTSQMAPSNPTTSATSTAPSIAGISMTATTPASPATPNPPPGSSETSR